MPLVQAHILAVVVVGGGFPSHFLIINGVGFPLGTSLQRGSSVLTSGISAKIFLRNNENEGISSLLAFLQSHEITGSPQPSLRLRFQSKSGRSVPSASLLTSTLCVTDGLKRHRFRGQAHFVDRQKTLFTMKTFQVLIFMWFHIQSSIFALICFLEAT